LMFCCRTWICHSWAVRNCAKTSRWSALLVSKCS
jgi:hypothetical protein